MKTFLLDLLICPNCLPQEFQLQGDIDQQENNDIITGSLNCPTCQTNFPITAGIANLNPHQSIKPLQKYEQQAVLSSYLWSHFSDIFNDEQASEAYADWAKLITPQSGLALDLGCAVGRFTFELAQTHDLAIGLDNSETFIKTARKLMSKRTKKFQLKDEGDIHQPARIDLPATWQTANIDFIVADALHLPFQAQTVATANSLNLIDKVPNPLKHLQEMDRVCQKTNSQFLLSDPFSWSKEVAPTDLWLGGHTGGKYRGYGQDNIARIISQKNISWPFPWQIAKLGNCWWKIRTHRNHYELIKSRFIKAHR